MKVVSSEGHATAPWGFPLATYDSSSSIGDRRGGFDCWMPIYPFLPLNFNHYTIDLLL